MFERGLEATAYLASLAPYGVSVFQGIEVATGQNRLGVAMVLGTLEVLLI